MISALIASGVLNLSEVISKDIIYSFNFQGGQDFNEEVAAHHPALDRI